MFCSKCGSQVAEGVAFCPMCGNKLAVAPVAPAQPVYEAPVAPVAPAQPVYEAPVAPVAPAQPVYEAPVAPVAPAQPAYQPPVAPVYDMPAYAAPVATQPAPKKNLTWLWILLGVLAVAGIAVGILFATGVLGGGKGKGEEGVANDPESVAKAYVEARLDGDMAKRFSLLAGDMQDAFEDGYASYEDQLFSLIESQAADFDIDVEIEDWDDFYDASQMVRKAENEEEYGEGYKFTFEVDEPEEWDEDDLERTIEVYSSSQYADYIDADKFEEGCSVVVKVIVCDDEGDEIDDFEYTVQVVKYDGKWKVLDNFY